MLFFTTIPWCNKYKTVTDSEGFAFSYHNHDIFKIKLLGCIHNNNTEFTFIIQNNSQNSKNINSHDYILIKNDIKINGSKVKDYEVYHLYENIKKLKYDYLFN